MQRAMFGNSSSQIPRHGSIANRANAETQVSHAPWCGQKKAKQKQRADWPDQVSPVPSMREKYERYQREERRKLLDHPLSWVRMTQQGKKIFSYHDKTDSIPSKKAR